MADQMIGNHLGVTAVNVGGGQNRSNLNGAGDTNNAVNGTNPQAGYLEGSQLSIEDMRARLAVIDATFYTAARLNTMTMNDMIYAIRVSDRPTNIKQ